MKGVLLICLKITVPLRRRLEAKLKVLPVLNQTKLTKLEPRKRNADASGDGKRKIPSPFGGGGGETRVLWRRYWAPFH